MFADLLRFELSLRCRRRQLHVYRWLYAAWVLFLFLHYFLPRLQGPLDWETPRSPALSAAAGSYFGVMLWQRFLFVLLATPAFVAGQITEEKQRGILQFVFLTELESRQIVPAKLLAQGYLLATVFLLDVPLLLLASAFEEFQLQTVAAHTVCMVMLTFA